MWRFDALEIANTAMWLRILTSGEIAVSISTVVELSLFLDIPVFEPTADYHTFV